MSCVAQHITGSLSKQAGTQDRHGRAGGMRQAPGQRCLLHTPAQLVLQVLQFCARAFTQLRGQRDVLQWQSVSQARRGGQASRLAGRHRDLLWHTEVWAELVGGVPGAGKPGKPRLPHSGTGTGTLQSHTHMKRGHLRTGIASRMGYMPRLHLGLQVWVHAPASAALSAPCPGPP